MSSKGGWGVGGVCVPLRRELRSIDQWGFAP
jgi:hypothetical protein